jgi:hypothetical protein
VEDALDARECFQEAAHFQHGGRQDIHLTPARLRALFAHLTLNGYPTVSIYNDEALRKTMLEDWIADGLTSLQVSPLLHCNNDHCALRSAPAQSTL